MSDPWLVWAWLWLALVALMCAVGIAHEVLAPRWTRRLRRLERARRLQAQEWQDRQDEERRKAAEWVKNHCFWRAE